MGGIWRVQRAYRQAEATAGPVSPRAGPAGQELKQAQRNRLEAAKTASERVYGQDPVGGSTSSS